MNNLVLKGRMVRDPELKVSGTGKEYTKFCIAVNRRFDKDKTDFFECKAWGQTAVFVNTYFKKGQEIVAIGSMQCNKFLDDDGNNRSYWEANIDNVEFCGSKKDNENQVAAQHYAAQSTPAPPSNRDFEEIVSDDNLPF